MTSHFSADRSNFVREARKDYAPLIQRVAEIHRDHRIHWDVNANAIVMESTLSCADLGRLFVEYVETGKRQEYGQHATIAPNELLCRKEGEFSDQDCRKKGLGASRFAAELRGETNALSQAFEQAREFLAKSGIKECLEESSVGLRRRRKRIFSDCEGEYQHDRRFDDFPFSRMISHKKEFPFLEVCFPMNMMYSASKEEVAEFSARCLALCEVIESAGYRVAIIGEDWNEGCIAQDLAPAAIAAGLPVKAGASHLKRHFHRLVMREAGEYGNIQEFAVYTSCEFYRRAMFAFLRSPVSFNHAIKGDIGRRCAYGYGQSLQDRPVPAKPGQMILDRDLISNVFSLSAEESKEIFSARLTATVRGGEEQSQAS